MKPAWDILTIANASKDLLLSGDAREMKTYTGLIEQTRKQMKDREAGSTIPNLPQRSRLFGPT